MPLIRVIGHWTAGSYNVSDIDKAHYHDIIDGDGRVVSGVHKPEDNENVNDGHYAAHTRNCNTGAIGISIAAMAGATETPFSAGAFPIKLVQWSAFILRIAERCKQYGILVTPSTVLTHAEVESTLGIDQAGKWDIARLPFEPGTVGAKAVGDKMRREVSAILAAQNVVTLVLPPASTIPKSVETIPNLTRASLAAYYRRLADMLEGKA